MKRKYKRGTARESRSIQQKKRINELNKVLANNIKETMQEKRFIYCPQCNAKLGKIENTYMGIAFLTIYYCPRCNWFDKYE